MKIYHTIDLINRIGKIVNEKDIRDGEIYDDGHHRFIWKRVGNNLYAKSNLTSRWEVHNQGYFNDPRTHFTNNCRIIEDK